MVVTNNNLLEQYQNFIDFDDTIPYQLKDNNIVMVYPIMLQDCYIFLSCLNILTIDKNSIGSVEIIQMSYLKYIVTELFKSEQNIYKLGQLLQMCLKMQKPRVINENNKIFIVDDNSNIKIGEKDFDAIKRIILFQNILDYDDEYINPDLKEAMDDMDKLKNNKFVPISLERKFAIISAHTGITKDEQKKMSYRSHCLLFKEVCGEVEFSTSRAIALYAGQKTEHWIFKNKKNKFDNYITSVDEYNKSMGGNGYVKNAANALSQNLLNKIK